MVLVSLFGGLGAVARYLLSRALDSRTAGRGTLVVNVAGSFVAGLVAGASMSMGASRALSLGFLGGFTTFSTWVSDALSGSAERTIFGYMVTSTALGIAAASCGLVLTGL